MSDGQTTMWQRRRGGGDTGKGEGGGCVVPMPPPAPGSARTPHGRLRLARAVPVEHAMEVASLAALEEAMALHGDVHGHGHRQRRQKGDASVRDVAAGHGGGAPRGVRGASWRGHGRCGAPAWRG